MLICFCINGWSEFFLFQPPADEPINCSRIARYDVTISYGDPSCPDVIRQVFWPSTSIRVNQSWRCQSVENVTVRAVSNSGILSPWSTEFTLENNQILSSVLVKDDDLTSTSSADYHLVKQSGTKVLLSSTDGINSGYPAELMVTAPVNHDLRRLSTSVANTADVDSSLESQLVAAQKAYSILILERTEQSLTVNLTALSPDVSFSTCCFVSK